MKRLVAEGGTAGQVVADAPSRDCKDSSSHSRKIPTALWVVATVISLSLTIAALYGWGVWFFSDHYYFGTRVAGVDAFGMTQDGLAQALDSSVQSYTLHADYDSLDLNVTSSDIDLSCDAQDVSKRLMDNQRPEFWPLSLCGGGTSWDLSFSYDSDKLSTLVGKAVDAFNKKARMPVSASLDLSESRDHFTLKSEQPGTALDSDAVYNVAQNAVLHGDQELAISDNELLQPEVVRSSEKAQKALKHANTMLGTTVPLAHGDKVLARIPSESLAPMLRADGLSLTVDQQGATSWADEYLWEDVEYTDDENHYVVDTEAFAKNLAEYVGQEEGSALQIPYASRARYLPGGGTLNPAPWNAELGRYVDVNKKTQTACLYDQNGKVIWETPVTTGREVSGEGTPTGQFCVYDKKSDFTLIGFDTDNDGKPEYEHHVDYWMPFNGGIGFHDASWRSVYGGEEYLERGSGGCVNLPAKAAKALYSMIHVNDVVIVHT